MGTFYSRKLVVHDFEGELGQLLDDAIVSATLVARAPFLALDQDALE